MKGVRNTRRTVFTTGDAAKILQVAPRTVSKWFDSGVLKGYRIPGSNDRRIPRESLSEFIHDHGMGSMIDDFEKRGAIRLVGLPSALQDALSFFGYFRPIKCVFDLANDLDKEPAVIVIDGSLGAKAVCAACQSIQARWQGRHKIVCIRTEDDSSTDYLAAGADYVLQSPVDPRQLVKLLWIEAINEA